MALLPPQFVKWKELLILYSKPDAEQTQAGVPPYPGSVLPGRMGSFHTTLRFKLTSPPQVSAEGQSVHSQAVVPALLDLDTIPSPGHCWAKYGHHTVSVSYAYPFMGVVEEGQGSGPLP